MPSNKESKYKTLDGRDAGKIEFESISDAKKWIDEYDDVQVLNTLVILDINILLLQISS